MRKVGVAAEILDEPRREPVRGQLGGEQHELLRIRNGRIEKGECVRQPLVCAVGRLCARLDLAAEQRLEPVERLTARRFFERERLLPGIQQLRLARCDEQRVPVGRAAAAARQLLAFLVEQRAERLFPFADAQQVAVQRVGQLPEFRGRIL